MPSLSTPLTQSQIKSFNRTLYSFYEDSGRHTLPWRSRRTPYAVFISEIMLQQTQVERVIPKFKAFMKVFPNFKRLAHASQRDVLRLWQGLGYNRRAIFLHRAAKTITIQYHGRLPQDPERLMALPGIGQATASSICVFAFNQPHVFIETNIRAVFIHHFFPEARTVDDREVGLLISQIIDTADTFNWYSALMDYGSFIKSSYSNPSRKSAHHIRQTRFEGSARQIRGEIVRCLTYNKYKTIIQLAKEFNRTIEDISRISKDLVREGFIYEDKRGISLKG